MIHNNPQLVADTERTWADAWYAFVKAGSEWDYVEPSDYIKKHRWMVRDGCSHVTLLHFALVRLFHVFACCSIYGLLRLREAWANRITNLSKSVYCRFRWLASISRRTISKELPLWVTAGESAFRRARLALDQYFASSVTAISAWSTGIREVYAGERREHGCREPRPVKIQYAYVQWAIAIGWYESSGLPGWEGWVEAHAEKRRGLHRWAYL